MPQLALHLPKSHTEATNCMTQIVTFVVKEENNGAQRRTRISFGRTMMQALKLLAKTPVSE